jgi:hypothetical protein
MSTAQGSILIKAPIGSVYRRWLRFEDSPQFMSAVKEVEKAGRKPFFHGRGVQRQANGRRA